jgi:ribosome-associated protein
LFVRESLHAAEQKKSLNMTEEYESKPSKSELKRRAHAAQELGEKLTRFPVETLNKLDLPDALRDAILQAQSIHARGGRKRQLQYIGKLMRDVDFEHIASQVAKLEAPQQQEIAVFHEVESWRDRLIEQGDTALTELIERFPEIDRNQIRQLVRNAQAEMKKNRPPKSKRQLFQILKNLLTT